MKPADFMNVTERSGGVTAVTTKRGNTLWRPGSILKGNLVGALISYDEHSFYQNHNNCTKALYKVSGYRWPCAIWFDNETGERVS